MTKPLTPRIGTAGWSIPSGVRQSFATEGSLLERYSSVFSCVEINSSFYRPLRAETYARWAKTVPAGFRFAVKMPRVITHEDKLHDVGAPLQSFIERTCALGSALGPILIQLPPSLKFQAREAEVFLANVRDVFAGGVVLEPRHPTWFEADADGLLRSRQVGRVAADPAPCPSGAAPGGWEGLRYWRFHGSPRTYYSEYGQERVRAIAERLAPADWCFFDNTASGAAVADALRLREL